MAKAKKASKKSKGKVVAGAGTGMVQGAIAAGRGLLGGKAATRGTTKGRSKSVSYWANKVLKAKLKKKFYRITYGGI